MKRFTVNVGEIMANGGATLNKQGEAVAFCSGYQVSKKEAFTLKAKNIKAIKNAINSVLLRISHEEGLYCGVWVSSGLVYIDISEHIKSEKRAIILGKARHQISIFNWSNGQCIYC